MIEIFNEPIENIAADAIVNASNGIGYMGGLLGRFIRLTGVAESIHYATKGEVERLAKEYLAEHPVQEGDVFVTSGGRLYVPILHAVTMNKPGSRSNLLVVEQCLQNLVQTVNTLGIKCVTIPYLGTGTGRLDKSDVKLLFDKYLADEDVLYIISDPKSK